MNVVAGEVPFEYTIEGLEQDSSEPAGFDVRVSAKNDAGYGRPSSVLNIKVDHNLRSLKPSFYDETAIPRRLH